MKKTAQIKMLEERLELALEERDLAQEQLDIAVDTLRDLIKKGTQVTDGDITPFMYYIMAVNKSMQVFEVFKAVEQATEPTEYVPGNMTISYHTTIKGCFYPDTNGKDD